MNYDLNPAHLREMAALGLHNVSPKDWKVDRVDSAMASVRKGTNKQLNLQKGRDFLGLRKVEIQPGSITIDPNPEASRAKTARLSKEAGI